MENEKRRALETYLKVSRSLCSTADKFESIGIKIWEGNLGESETVRDDFTNANEELLKYCRKLWSCPKAKNGILKRFPLIISSEETMILKELWKN